MVYICHARTDLNELIGSERWEDERLSFHYGPLALAMKAGEELVLENSASLSVFMLRKISLILGALYIDDTTEVIRPGAGFQLVLR